MMMSDLNALLEPGQRVKHPTEHDWGTGQVQSNVAGKVTVNFPEAGKVVIDSRHITLVPIFE